MTIRWGRAGAGVLLVARDTGRILLALRSAEVMEPGTWGIPGGRVEEGDTAKHTAVTEVHEEFGIKLTKRSLTPLYAFVEPGFRYDTFMSVVPNEQLDVTLNWESDDARWFNVDSLPKPLHFGTKLLLSDTGVRKKIHMARTRRNPLITQHISGKKKVVSYGEMPMRQAASAKQFAGIEENVIVYGPFGKVGEFFGFHPSTSVLYLFADPADRKEMYESLRADKVKQPPLFQRRRPMFGGHPGTLEAFWKNRATSKMMAAIQYFVDGDTLVVTHMAVRPKWRRNRVNTFLVDWIAGRVGAKQIAFEEPTEEGGKFMKTYGGKEWVK